MDSIWHTVIVVLLVGVPIVVVVGVVALIVRAGRPVREERVALRTAHLLREQGEKGR